MMLLCAEENGVSASCCRTDSSPVDAVWSRCYCPISARSTHSLFSTGKTAI